MKDRHNDDRYEASIIYRGMEFIPIWKKSRADAVPVEIDIAG